MQSLNHVSIRDPGVHTHRKQNCRCNTQMHAACFIGASVIYADTVADLGYADELGNYAEYSGAPNLQVCSRLNLVADNL